MKTHELKTWPEFFDAIWDGTKTFEVRKNDRDFQVGDYLYLREWDPHRSDYTGRHGTVRVGYVLRGPICCLPDGCCVMAISLPAEGRGG